MALREQRVAPAESGTKHLDCNLLLVTALQSSDPGPPQGFGPMGPDRFSALTGSLRTICMN